MSSHNLSADGPKRIGFVSTRFQGTDGVTLEAKKWAHILQGMGHQSFWAAGLLDTPLEVSHEVPLAYFNHPQVAVLQAKLFGAHTRSRATTDEIHAIKEKLKDDLYLF